jgi:hypothetical protein
MEAMRSTESDIHFPSVLVAACTSVEDWRYQQTRGAADAAFL